MNPSFIDFHFIGSFVTEIVFVAATFSVILIMVAYDMLTEQYRRDRFTPKFAPLNRYPYVLVYLLTAKAPIPTILFPTLLFRRMLH